MDIFKKIKNHINDKFILIGMITLVLFSFILVNYTFSKDIIIKDFGSQIEVKTMAFTVKDVMSRSNIELEEADVINYALDDPLKDGMVIDITRAKQVRVIDGDKEIVITSAKDKVRDILEQGNVKIDGMDIVIPGLEEEIDLSRTIKIVKVEEKIISEEEVIPFNTVVTYNNDMDYDEYNVVNQGRNGLREVSYKVTYENGQETQRVVADHKVITKPIDKKIEKAEEKYLVSSRGQVIRYKSVMIMEATAYDLSVGSTGKTPDHPEYGITFSGTRARPGVVAVDPRVIPLGTKLYVESLDSTKDYGVASAEDTGSAIKGKKIDLFMENSKAAWRFGRRKVRVYILDKNYQ